ncbi:hypothetical protein LX32DRAFT_633799 [Colletotrichum zoysiae]|uniref:Uncharacterized protein n=1 Tax=Colletotrichum zoysiae TaxID=1216348 RepID=A0AAD9M6A9_9PEZI|nr:hypothetical protein LX32DRAFT_633799 [Colletotrichum zoysiae]
MLTLVLKGAAGTTLGADGPVPQDEAANKGKTVEDVGGGKRGDTKVAEGVENTASAVDAGPKAINSSKVKEMPPSPTASMLPKQLLIPFLRPTR